jgi:hypothetical protein
MGASAIVAAESFVKIAVNAPDPAAFTVFPEKRVSQG